jgi:hypothetical protein
MISESEFNQLLCLNGGHESCMMIIKITNFDLSLDGGKGNLVIK